MGELCYTFDEKSEMRNLHLILAALLLLSAVAYAGLHRLTTDPAYDGAPSWSPDGIKIAFTSNRSGFNNIWVMNSDGTNQHNISNVSHNDQVPAYSPDGKKIAFCSDRAGNGDFDIYVMPANGGTATRITTSSLNEVDPTWSPDMSYIAYHAFVTSMDYMHIWKVVATGGAGTQLTFGNDDDMKPSWSPDGTRIAFYTTRFGPGAQVCTMTTEGESILEICDGNTPCWSPDSMYLAFELYNIYTIPAVGGLPTQITFFTNAQTEVPSWSPDGNKIAFDHPTSFNWDIWYVDLNDEEVETTTLGKIKTLYK